MQVGFLFGLFWSPFHQQQDVLQSINQSTSRWSPTRGRIKISKVIYTEKSDGSYFGRVAMGQAMLTLMIFIAGILLRFQDHQPRRIH